MGCNKYQHQCGKTDSSTRPCPAGLSQGCVSDPRRPLRFELWVNQSPVNNILSGLMAFLSCSVSRNMKMLFRFLATQTHEADQVTAYSAPPQKCPNLSVISVRNLLYIVHTQYILVLWRKKEKKLLIKGRNTAENSPGSVRAASCSTRAVICVSGNDLCHSASNRDLTLQLTHTLFIAVSVIPLYSRRVRATTPSCWEQRDSWYLVACWVKVFTNPRA